VTDPDGKPVMVGKGKRRRANTRIVAKHAEGRAIDLHAKSCGSARRERRA